MRLIRTVREVEIVGVLRRNESNGRTERIKGELTEGIGHLKCATNEAATSAAEKVSPHVNRALTAVGLRKRRRRRWPWAVGALAVAGAAATAAGLVLWRRGSRCEEEDLFVEDLDPDSPQGSEEAAAYHGAEASSRREPADRSLAGV